MLWAAWAGSRSGVGEAGGGSGVGVVRQCWCRLVWVVVWIVKVVWRVKVV